MTRTSLIVVALLATMACRKPPFPCPDCEDEDAEDADDDEPPLPDLPCGGADLLTDNLNCGSCGTECSLWKWDSPWDAGFCVDGKCGPGWTITCIPEAIGLSTCAEVCEVWGEGHACVSGGCAGYAGILFDTDLDGNGCGPHFKPPVATVTTCDEPIPWASNNEFTREVMCCCDFPNPPP